MGLDEDAKASLIFDYGFKPSQFFSNSCNQLNVEVSPLLTIFTSMFLHGGMLHLFR